MKKVLVFDADKSLASIGSPEKQAEVFGFPPISCDSLQEFKAITLPLLTVKEVQTKHELLDHVTGTQYVTTFTDKAKSLGLKGVALDSLSHMCKRTFRIVVKEKQGTEDPPFIDRGVWFDFRDYGNRILAGIARMDVPVIANCHIRRQEGKTGDELVPSVVTDLRTDIPQYFDMVFYSKKKTVDGTTEFYWITESDSMHINAKVRQPEVRAVLSKEVPQNLGMVLRISEEHGKPDPKILIMGDSGFGKTSALATINGYFPPQFNKQ